MSRTTRQEKTDQHAAARARRAAAIRATLDAPTVWGADDQTGDRQ